MNKFAIVPGFLSEHDGMVTRRGRMQSFTSPDGRSVMRNADEPQQDLSEASSSFAQGEADDHLPLNEYSRGPARGIALGLVPAVLVWTGLIALFAKLLKP